MRVVSFRPALRRTALVPLVATTLLVGVGLGARPAEAAGTTPAQQGAAFARVLAASSASISARAVDNNGVVLGAVHDTTSLPPASTQKIATVGTALKVLGPTKRFTTKLQGTRPFPPSLPWKTVTATRYRGDLVVVASGDPSLRTAGMESLLKVVPAHGIRTVSGGLWLDVSLFDRVRTAPGWKSSWLGTEVGPLSAFVLEQNRSRRDSAYLRDPDTGNLQTMRSWLKSHGVTVLGGIHVGRPATPALAPLNSVSSVPLSSLATLTLRDSVNMWAEVLLKDIGAASGTGSSAHGIEVVRATVAAAGGTAGTASDGSGLSQYDRATARQELATVTSLGRTDIGPTMLADLPVSCTNGTLLHRLCTLKGRVHAKTGTLDGVSCLTGYVTDYAGRRLWFSVQVKGSLTVYERTGLIDRAVRALAG